MIVYLSLSKSSIGNNYKISGHITLCCLLAYSSFFFFFFFFFLEILTNLNGFTVTEIHKISQKMKI